MSSGVAHKTELIAGASIYRGYKEALHLLDPDEVKKFRSELRAFRTSLFRAIFHPNNKPYRVNWHDSATAYETGYQKEIEGENPLFLDDKKFYIKFKTSKKSLKEDRDTNPKLKGWKKKKRLRYHYLNTYVMSYFYRVKSHLLKYGDQAYANIGTILPNIPEALIGSVTNLKKMDIIEDPNYDKTRPTLIRLHARDVIDLARANRDFEDVCWEEWEQLLLNPNHEIEFNKEGKISIDPVIETQFAHMISALYDGFYAHKLWMVHYQMQDIMTQAEVARKQLHDQLTVGLNETLEYVEAYGQRYTREILELAAMTKKFNNMFTDVEIKLDKLESAISEDGILSAFAKTIENMHDEVDFIDDIIDDKLKRLESANNYAKTAKATLWRRIKELEDRTGENMGKLVNKYMVDYNKGNLTSVQDKLDQLRSEEEEEQRLLDEENSEEEFEEELIQPKAPGFFSRLFGNNGSK